MTPWGCASRICPSRQKRCAPLVIHRLAWCNGARMPRVGCLLQRDGMVETVHDATTPPRTGGPRQRSGELSTIAGENRSHQGTHCRRSCGLSLLPAGRATVLYGMLVTVQVVKTGITPPLAT